MAAKDEDGMAAIPSDVSEALVDLALEGRRKKRNGRGSPPSSKAGKDESQLRRPQYERHDQYKPPNITSLISHSSI